MSTYTSTTQPRPPPSATPLPESMADRHASTSQDRTMLVTNLPYEATELTLRHLLHGIMARTIEGTGGEPSIKSVRFSESTATSVDSRAAVVEFPTSHDCQTAVNVLQSQADRLHFHGNTLHISKMNDHHHIDHASKEDPLRESINKRPHNDEECTMSE